jgi:hypothetical protein
MDLPSMSPAVHLQNQSGAFRKTGTIVYQCETCPNLSSIFMVGPDELHFVSQLAAC